MEALLADDSSAAPRATKNALGTINGCYIPCLLNILGAPLFLFVGFAVGMLGWGGALALFCFSELIAYLTITSFSALVTNGRMKGGGAYYMISRSLGPAFGGSSGLLFWLTYCINVTFNTSAFTDTVFATWFPAYVDCTLEAKNGHCWYKVAFSTATLFILFLVAFKGAAAFARVNYFIFAGLVVALVVAIGSVWFTRTEIMVASDMAALQYTPSELTQFRNLTAYYRPWALRAACKPDPPGVTTWCNLGPELTGGNGHYGLLETFSYSPVLSGQCDMAAHSTDGTLCDLPHVFSFVFPAVVGMMEGANLSGDLADPGHSIPRGTVAAVSTAFVCYILLIFGQAGTMDRGALQYDLSVMQQSCVSQYFVVLGIGTACLSTALGSMFGSARIMQALARDNIYPPFKVFAPGTLNGDEPRRALVLTYLLAQAGLFYGGIDAVAPVLTNFFLVTYTLTNLSAALLELAGLPNFRPAWRVYSWHLSLAGAALTVAAMIFLNWVFAIITIALVCALFVFIYATFDASSWVDISQPLSFLFAKATIRSLGRSAAHAKYWRPNALVLLPEARTVDVPLLHVASELSHGALLLAGHASTPKTANALRASESTPRAISAGEAALVAHQELEERLSSAASLANQQKLPPLEHAYPYSGVDASTRLGLVNLVSSAGIGSLRANTVLMPLPERGSADGIVESSAECAALVSDLIAMRKNMLLLCNLNPSNSAPLAQHSAARIDMWIFGDISPEGVSGEKPQPTGELGADDTAPSALDAGLALQFAFLAKRALARAHGRAGSFMAPAEAPTLRVLQLLPSATSGDHAVCINDPVQPATNGVRPLEAAQTSTTGLRRVSAAADASLRSWLKELRVDAEAVVFEPAPAMSGLTCQDPQVRELAQAAVRTHSADASLVVMLLPTASLGESTRVGDFRPASVGFVDSLHDLTAGLPTTILCKSGGDAVVTTEI